MYTHLKNCEKKLYFPKKNRITKNIAANKMKSKKTDAKETKFMIVENMK